MEFRTTFNCEPSSYKISHQQKVITAGSCFADVVGQRLAENKFHVLTNPFGNIYNPISLHTLLAQNPREPSLTDHAFVERGGIWYNHHLHSAYAALTKDALSEKIAATFQNLRHWMQEADWLIITYGTSWVYERVVENDIVANCHKIPSSHFKKRLLDEAEVVSSFNEIHSKLTSLNPKLRIILTVSPVRHIKDTLPLNNVSKAILRVACHKLTQQFKNVSYFPSYELMMDDLRDYRFYKTDMIHPTDDAEHYIWKKFGDVYFNPDTRNFIATWKKITAALNHKAFYAQSDDHQRFLRSTLEKLEALQGSVDVSDEAATIKQQLR